jgi:leader peptidase (prepilin peptidase)/N-methyltransferase
VDWTADRRRRDASRLRGSARVALKPTDASVTAPPEQPTADVSMLQAATEIHAAYPWFFSVLAFLFGAIVGSFLNVCIYRIPAGRSIVTPGSTCACGKPVAWYDNIPIVSWLLLRGRARCCGGRFSVRYPAIELLTGVIFLLCWERLPVEKALPGMLLASILICATFIDFDHMIIPDRFTIGAAVVGVAVSALVPGLHEQASGFYFVDAVRSTLSSMVGVLIGSGVVLWIALLAEVVLRKEAMGFGDVKFLGAIGAFLGWEGGVFAVFGGAILGTLGFAFVFLVQRMLAAGRRRPRAIPTSTSVETSATASASEIESEADVGVGFGKQTPFGPMLAAGALLYMLWLHPWVDGYFGAVRQMLYDYY